MSEKRRQHYVPKFYLRNFSQSDKAISTFNFKDLKYIENAPIRNMCQKSNFYGNDKRVEEFLDKEIERGAAKIIKRIIETSSLPHTPEEYLHLIAFLLVSEARNLKSSDSTEYLVDSTLKEIIKKHPDFKDIDVDEFSIKLNHPANRMIEVALSSIPLVLDLQPILIVQKTSRQFITSDNPLVRYNSFYIERNYRGRGFGYITRGLQLFFPISPDKCILFYDSIVYDIPNAENNILYINRAREVDHLNELFYLNGYNNVFFNNRVKEEYIRKIHIKNKNTPKISDLEREIQVFNSIDRNSQVIGYTNNRVTKKIKLPWLKITKIGNSLILPAHMGGLTRLESPFIKHFLDAEKKKFKKQKTLLFK